MTIKDYAAHRKASGLPGGTTPGVKKAIESGRLGNSARIVDGGWVVDMAAADKLWAENTEPLKGQSTTGNQGGRPPSYRRAGTGQYTARMEGAKLEAEGGATSGQSYQKLKAFNEGLKAQFGQLDLAKRKGELVELRSINTYVASMILKARDELRRIGPELQNKLALERDPIKCELMVTERVDRALNALAEFKPE